MKQIKLIIALLTATALIFSCNPKAKTPTTKVDTPTKVEKKEMNGIKFTETYKIKLPFLDYDDGAEVTAKDGARGGRKPKANQVSLSVEELPIEQEGSNLITSIPDLTVHFGVNKWSDGTFSDGVGLCPRTWYPVPSPATTISCTHTGAGIYMSWTGSAPFINSNGATQYVISVSPKLTVN